MSAYERMFFLLFGVFLIAAAVAILVRLLGRGTDLSQRIADRIAERGEADFHSGQDLTGRRCAGRMTPQYVAGRFGEIAAAMPDLDHLDRHVAGLYLIPEETT